MNTQIKNSKKGFTLVELVVVIAILAILAAIAIPVVTSIINTASRNSAKTDAQSIELAIKEAKADFTAKNSDTYPGIKSGNAPTIAQVATAKSIASAFESKTVDNKSYFPHWNPTTGKVVFALKAASGATSTTDVDNNTVNNPVLLEATSSALVTSLVDPVLATSAST
jgi:prepilin-type N-terminal cleavage/methylation domain-containing protein